MTDRSVILFHAKQTIRHPRKAPPQSRPNAGAGEGCLGRGGEARIAASRPAIRAAPNARRSGAQAIVEAALEEFVARGFTATRLDDVAKRAGVAKGTIYLHFKDKESMFEELIRTAIVPLIGRLHAPPPTGGSVRDAIEGFARTFIQEVATTRRGDIVRLIVAEGPRFPAIADFYYREVISRGLAGMRALIELGVARGEIRAARSWRAFRRSWWRRRSSR